MAAILSYFSLKQPLLLVDTKFQTLTNIQEMFKVSHNKLDVLRGLGESDFGQCGFPKPEVNGWQIRLGYGDNLHEQTQISI